MMVLGEYVCDITPTGEKALIHSTTNRIISMKTRPGNLLNGRVIHMDLVSSLITLIDRSVSETFSSATVVLRVYLPGIILLIFSNSLSI